jgi:hypothetical protein
MAERTPRTVQGRESEKRIEAWKNPRLLPDPEPEKGFRYRWVRSGSLGSLDTVNVSMRMREGYRPVAMTEHPDMQVVKDERSRFPDMVEVGGLMLCKIPEEIPRSREETQTRQSVAQVDAVDNHYLRESDPRMPLARPQRESRVTYGSRPPSATKDEK